MPQNKVYVQTTVIVTMFGILIEDNWIQKDEERVVMSAESNLAGLLSPCGDEKWNKDLGQIWQPISVYPIPYEQDDFLDTTKLCKRRGL